MSDEGSLLFAFADGPTARLHARVLAGTATIFDGELERGVPVPLSVVGPPIEVPTYVWVPTPAWGEWTRSDGPGWIEKKSAGVVKWLSPDAERLYLDGKWSWGHFEARPPFATVPGPCGGFVVLVDGSIAASAYTFTAEPR